jgi:hypothetical protein
MQHCMGTGGSRSQQGQDGGEETVLDEGLA